MASQEAKRWTVIFLVDDNPPRKIGLLQRAADKSFAPNWFTGLGGKIGDLAGSENETPLESAYRELEEETLGKVTKKNIKLVEFARYIYQGTDLKLYYFWGKYPKERLPTVGQDEGSFKWMEITEIFDREIIPTTREVCKEWAKRNFQTDKPWTIFAQELGWDRGVRRVKVLEVKDGLV